MDIEQSTLIWIARMIFAFILAFVGYSVWRLMRRKRFFLMPERKTYHPPAHIELPEKNIVINVMARPGRLFESHLLYKVMYQLGFKYSENQVFEYFVPDTNCVAFSIINHRPPYIFSAYPEGMYPTNGLSAVMQLPVADGDDQVEYFHLILSVLDQMRNGLDAELCDSRRSKLKNHQLYNMQRDIELFEQNYINIIQHGYHCTND